MFNHFMLCPRPFAESTLQSNPESARADLEPFALAPFWQLQAPFLAPFKRKGRPGALRASGLLFVKALAAVVVGGVRTGHPGALDTLHGMA